MNTKMKVLAAAVGLGLGMASVQATAAITWFSPFTGFQDDNLDFFLKRDAAGVLNLAGGQRTGILDVGDVTVAVFEVNNTVRIGGAPASALINGGELTGIVGTQVLTKVNLGGGLFSYTFGAVTEGLNSILATAGIAGVAGGGVGGQTSAAIYFGPSLNLDLITPDCLNFIDCMQKAADDPVWEVDGFGGDQDNFWNAQGGDNIGTIAESIALNLAQVQFGQSIVVNATGQSLTDVPCAPFATCTDGALGGNERVGMLGGGSIHGGFGLQTVGAYGRSDFDFTKAVPEPVSLALLGVGLLGMGASLRRKVR